MSVRIKKLLRDWYQGETKISEPPILAIWSERHWTSRLAHAFIDFHLKEWKWALPFYVALAGLGLRFAGLV
ncbi:MAG TPA: hypothetical protein VK999_02745 [Methylotenera sp.]|nr:hypothetical protein [Methylotenera sp.]